MQAGHGVIFAKKPLSGKAFSVPKAGTTGASGKISFEGPAPAC
jgi:hypothetical protein